MKTSLLLIDIQNDYFPGGRMPLEEPEVAGYHARQMLTAFRQAGLPIAHIQHVATQPGATYFLPGTEGTAIHESVRPLPHEVVFQKQLPNSFRDTPLLPHLLEQQIHRLVISGMMTHMCIDATVRAASDYGFECMIAHDACATKTLIQQGESIPARKVHLAFLAALNGAYGKVMGTSEIAPLIWSEVGSRFD